MTITQWIVAFIGAIWILALFFMQQVAVLERGTYYQEVLYLLRIVIIIPLGAVMTGLSIRLLDAITPASWLPDEWESEYAKALIVCTLLYGLCWLAVQG